MELSIYRSTQCTDITSGPAEKYHVWENLWLTQFLIVSACRHEMRLKIRNKLICIHKSSRLQANKIKKQFNDRKKRARLLETLATPMLATLHDYVSIIDWLYYRIIYLTVCLFRQTGIQDMSVSLVLGVPDQQSTSHWMMCALLQSITVDDKSFLCFSKPSASSLHVTKSFWSIRGS